MDDHVSNSHVHFLGMPDIGTVEVSEPFLENELSLVHSWVVSDLDHSIVNLFCVHLIYNLVC